MTLAGRYAWVAARAVDSTIRQLERQGVVLNPEISAVAAALSRASAAWRSGETFAEANMRIRDEGCPVTFGEMTTKDVSVAMGIGVPAVQARAARGTLPHSWVGRVRVFDPADVERVLEEAL